MILLEIPTGSSSEVVQEYYQQLYAHYLSGFGQQVGINWTIFAWVSLWILVLVGSLYAYTRWQRGTKHTKEPYPVESYDGHIQEMNGPVGPFLWLFFIGMFIWIMTLMTLHLLNGQVY